MILHDQHVHSMYSADSDEKLVNYLDVAFKMGCKYFVTTEHFDLDLVEFHENWIADYKKLNEELNLLKEKYPNIEMLLGIEVGYRKDKLDFINKKLDSFDFDVINLSIHDCKFADFYWIKYFEKFGIKEMFKYKSGNNFGNSFSKREILSGLL